NTLVFTNGAKDAQTYLRSADTVTVKVTDEEGEISKNLNVGYKNSAVIPDAAQVSSSAVSINLEDGDNSLSMDELLFGKADEEQLVLDDGNYSIAVDAKAENSGYKYNKPLVSVTGTDGEVMSLGTALYGSTTDELDGANLWSNDFVNKTLLNQGFKVDGFDYDVSVTNVDVSEGVSVNAESGVTGLDTSDDTAKFRVVVKGIYIEGADKEEANNLLSNSVQFDVSIKGSDDEAAEGTPGEDEE